jgi:hypothetical protein
MRVLEAATDRKARRPSGRGAGPAWVRRLIRGRFS